MGIHPPDRTFVGPAVRWEDNGCAECRARWTRLPAAEPRELGESPAFMVTVYRCGVCGAYWESGYVNPHEITRTAAEARLPDLEDRERLAGL